MGKIVTDTNVWYTLDDAALFEKVKSLRLAPNHVNIYELSTSFNLMKYPEETRRAIQRMFHYTQHAILEPALIHLAKLKGPYEYDYNEINTFLQFTELYAKGHNIKEEEKEGFKKWLSSTETNLVKAADMMNAEADRIRPNISDKKAHRKKDTEQLTLHFINYLVETVTGGRANLREFDFRQAELLVRVLDCYFKKLETTGMKMDANDWFDFTILAYVQPGDKFWTSDGRWIQLIKEAKMESYLFTP